MSEIYTMKTGSEDILFRLEINRHICIGVNVMNQSGIWKWNYISWISKYGEIGLNMLLKDQNFVFENQKVTLELNKHFYDLIKKIKHHPEYRLRVINLLDEKTRKIWDAV